MVSVVNIVRRRPAFSRTREMGRQECGDPWTMGKVCKEYMPRRHPRDAATWEKRMTGTTCKDRDEEAGWAISVE
jgi:hypothetical protein